MTANFTQPHGLLDYWRDMLISLDYWPCQADSLSPCDYSSLKMTIPQIRSLCTILLKMSHFIRSVSDHGKCGIILKLSTVGVYSCVF